MAPGGEMFRYPQHFGENVLRHGSHEWLPYSVDEVRLKCSNTNLSSGKTTLFQEGERVWIFLICSCSRRRAMW